MLWGAAGLAHPFIHNSKRITMLSRKLDSGDEMAQGLEAKPEGLDAGFAIALARHEQASSLIHTDGLTELHMANGNSFGHAGIPAAASGGADEIFDRLAARLEQERANQHDDVSMALIPLPPGEREGENLKALEGERTPLSRATQIDAAMLIVDRFDRGLVLTDANQRIIFVNPMFSRITGYTQEEAIGKTPRLLSSGRHGPEFYRAMWNDLLNNGAWRGEIWNRRKDGALYLEWLDIRALRNANGVVEHYLATFTAIDQQLGQEERLRFLALHDALTGLANRLLLTDRGEHALRQADCSGRAVAVMFIDLDRFKSINDSLGHGIGDEVLIQVAKRLTSALRSEDILARFGGDEFVCLLPDIADRHDAGMAANKLLAALDKPIDIAGHKFKVVASIGVSAYPSDGRTLDDLIVAADRAMMRAKQSGGNMVKFFSAEMAVAVERQLELEAQLEEALKLGRLELHYQPKIDLKTRRIVGAEALVRWRDPVRGLVPPSIFIPVAERSDLIAKIGNWVLMQACSMLAEREPALPGHFHVAVNVSQMQLERCDLPAEVAQALQYTAINPARLQLEVTESMFIRDENAARESLQQIARMGVSVALDDFGTGYSNLGALSQLPLDTFKLDQRFVRNIDKDMSSESIARSVWHLADGLGKQIVVEGIETCEECSKMMALGYRVGQGYRFAKPLPEKEFFEFLRNWAPDRYPCRNGGKALC
jgi:diguanylate cyclase (GGDEF)-like protein/PAS domain S-box-containing protein